MKKFTLAFCILTFGSSTAYAASTDLKGDVAAGKAKAATCMACHGADGNGNPNNLLWPKLAGQYAGYLVQQLQAFKAKDREDPSMAAMVVPLTEPDIINLAAYFASLPRKNGSASEKLLELGQRIYRGGNKESSVAACIACHGPRGLGNPAALYPSIGGQQAAYSKKQLTDYKSGARKLKNNVFIMHDIAVNMSPEEMEAVTDYMQGLY